MTPRQYNELIRQAEVLEKDKEYMNLSLTKEVKVSHNPINIRLEYCIQFLNIYFLELSNSINSRQLFYYFSQVFSCNYQLFFYYNARNAKYITLYLIECISNCYSIYFGIITNKKGENRRKTEEEYNDRIVVNKNKIDINEVLCRNNLQNTDYNNKELGEYIKLVNFIRI